MLPISDFYEMLNTEEFDKCLKSNQKRIIDDITEGDYISMHKFVELLDMFNFLPIKKELNKNQSSIIYEIMSGGNLKQATVTNPALGGLHN